MVGIVWSGGADFGGTFGANWSIDLLTIPPGLATGYPSIVPTVIFTSTASQATTDLYFVDPLLVETRINGQWVGGTTVYTADVPSFPLARSSGLDFNVGGTLRLKAPSAATIVGTMVAVLVDTPTRQQGNSQLLDPFSERFLSAGQTPFSNSGTLSYIELTLLMISNPHPQFWYSQIASLASSAAIAPDVSGALGWTNYITRINGTLCASIGVYSGVVGPDLASPLPPPFSVTIPANVTKASIAYSYVYGSGIAIVNGRSFAQLVGA